MKKLLVISRYYPYPAEKNGDTHAVINIIKYMSGYEVDIFYYGEDRVEEVDFSEDVKNVYYEDLRKKGSSRWNQIRSLLALQTYTLFQHKKKSKVLEELLKKDYDCIYVDQHASMNYINQIPSDKKILLFMCDSMPMFFDRKKRIEKTFISNVYYSIQAMFSKSEEKKYYKKADKIVFVSSIDVEYEKKVHPQHANKFLNCGIGTELQYIEMSTPVNMEKKSVIFTGIMDYAPNEDAMVYFIQEIWNEIIQRHREAKLYIVGKNPTSKLQELCANDDSIIITGRVDDIFAYIKGARVYVSPLRFGSGKKNKIIEAMACGRPIVASETSLEGFEDITLGQDIILAKTNEEWIESVCELLADDDKCADMSSRCKKLVDEKYDWGRIADNVMLF